MNNRESNIMPNIGGAPLPASNKVGKSKVDNTPKSQDEIFEMMEAIKENPDIGVHKVEGIAEDAPPMTREQLEAMIATKRPDLETPKQNYVEVDYNQLTRETKHEIPEEKPYQPGPTDILTTTIELPSQGYFGGPSKVQIRPMTIKEEEILYLADDNPTYLDDIALSCIVSPKNVTLDQLHPNDLLYILYAIRNISFGSTYKQNSICPTCRQNNLITVDITKLPLDCLDEKYINAIRNVHLHDKDNIVTINIPTEGDLLRLDDLVKEGIKKNKITNPSQAKLFEFRLRRDSRIEELDGVPFKSKNEKAAFMDSLTSRDYNLITNAAEKIREAFGLDRSIEVKCNNCKRTYESEAAIVPEFFRPSYEDEIN